MLANPPSILLPEAEVDRIMQSLGSTKEISGSWLPVVVRVGKRITSESGGRLPIADRRPLFKFTFRRSTCIFQLHINVKKGKHVFGYPYESMQELHPLAKMSERLGSELPLSREGKPRDKGITIVSDSFGPMDKELLALSAEFIDYVKIGQSLPLIIERSKLLERIRYYHDLGIRVSSGGTLIQAALKRRIVSQILEKLRSVGFDVVEISESAGDMTNEAKQELLNSITKLSMDYVFEVGRKDPKHALSTAYMISKIQEAFELKSPKVVIEAGLEGAGVGFYDSNGEVSWDALNEIVGRFGPPNLIFEAPECYREPRSSSNLGRT